MRLITLFLTTALAGSTASIAESQNVAAPTVLTQPASPPTYPVKGSNGAVIGSVMLSDGPTGVLISVAVNGLAPGWHGMHFHEKADCSDAAFKNSGGHMNHDPKLSHGLLASGGPDFGDLPNLWVAPDGSGRAQVFSTTVSLRPGTGRALLRDSDGSALVIHALPDDQMTQPIGGAGARVACAAIGPAGLIPAGQ